MALPALAPTVFRRMDPRDRLDVYAVLTQGDELKDILQPGEEVREFWIDLPTDSYQAGLRLDDGERAPRYKDLVFVFVLYVEPSKRALPIFDGAGFKAAVEITFTTNFSDREKQYSLLVWMVNK